MDNQLHEFPNFVIFKIENAKVNEIEFLENKVIKLAKFQKKLYIFLKK